MSDVLNNLPGLEATGADFDRFHGSRFLCPHFEEVGKPGPARSILRVRNVIAECGTFTADFTLTGHMTLR